MCVSSFCLKMRPCCRLPMFLWCGFLIGCSILLEIIDMKTIPKLKILVSSISLALISIQALNAQELPQLKVDTQSNVQRVSITGSNIKKTDAETAAPLQIISKDDILRSGASTVKDILELSTSNDRTAISDLGGENSWASGASGVSLRNLGINSTLVLINGRRLPGYGFADGLQSTFVNIDTLPASAIERVEILKDGASAVYGSSAIGGVINIITTKNFNGVKMTASAQQSLKVAKFDRNQTVGIIGGFGDLDKDGYNIMAGLDLYQRGSYKDDYVNRRLPAYYLALNPSRDTGKIDSLSTGAYPGNFTGRYPSNYADAALAGKTISKPLNGCAEENLISGLCRYNYWKDSDAMPNSQRAVAFMFGTMNFGGGITGTLDAQFANMENDYYTSIPRSNVNGGQLTWYDSIKGELQYFKDPQIPTGHAQNPYSFPIGVNYRFADYPDMFKNVGGSQVHRIVASLQGNNYGWEWDSSVGTMGSQAHQRQRLYRDRYAYADAITSGEYVYGGKNSRELLERMFPLMGSDGKSKESWIDFKAAKDIMTLAGGLLSIAVGADVRHETFKHISMDNILKARIVQYSGASINGSRNVSAAFAELNAPLTKDLEVGFALRADKSGPTKLELIPKSNVSYTVTDSLKLRASLSRGYRAPSLPETGNGGASWFTSGDDPKRCDMANQIWEALQKGNANDRANANVAYYSGCQTSFPSTVTPNVNLEPERSKIYGLGFVLATTKSSYITVDYWNVKRFNEISVYGSDYILANEDKSPDLVIRGALSPEDIDFAQRASELAGVPLGFKVGKVQGVKDQYKNTTKTYVSGLDITMGQRWNLAEYGKIDLKLDAQLNLDYRWYESENKRMSDSYIGYRGQPRLTNVLSLNWSKNAWNIGTRARWTSGTKLAWGEQDTVNSFKACAKRGLKSDQCRLGADLVVDLNASYSGFNNTRIGFNIFNIANRQTQIQYRIGAPLPLRGPVLKLWGEYRF